MKITFVLLALAILLTSVGCSVPEGGYYLPKGTTLYDFTLGGMKPQAGISGDTNKLTVDFFLGYDTPKEEVRGFVKATGISYASAADVKKMPGPAAKGK